MYDGCKSVVVLMTYFPPAHRFSLFSHWTHKAGAIYSMAGQWMADSGCGTEGLRKTEDSAYACWPTCDMQKIFLKMDDCLINLSSFRSHANCTKGERKYHYYIHWLKYLVLGIIILAPSRFRGGNCNS